MLASNVALYDAGHRYMLIGVEAPLASMIMRLP